MTTTDILATVIIASHKRPNQLLKAVKNVNRSYYPNVEIIVVYEDDRDLHKSLISSPPENVECIKNNGDGLSGARNTGIEAANGEYIAFLDDDDRWFRNTLPTLVDSIDSNTGKIAYGGNVSINKSGDIVNIYKPKKQDNLSSEILKGNFVGSPSQIIVEADALRQTEKFDEQLNNIADWEFYIRFAQKYKFIYIQDIIMRRLSHNEAMSQITDDVSEAGDYILSKHKNIFTRYGLYPYARSSHHERVGILAVLDGEIERARTELQRSLETKLRMRTIIIYIVIFIGGKEGFRFLRKMKRNFERIKYKTHKLIYNSEVSE